MRYFYFALFVLSLTTISSQENLNPTDFLLEAPESWRKETLSLPLSFAPELNYEGIEYVRFSKGWGDQSSKDFWTYTFAWYLDDDPNLTSKKLNKELKLYFDGLLNIIASGKGIDKRKVTPTITNLEYEEDQQYFIGKVTIFDAFFSEKQIPLHVIVKPTYCESNEKYITYFRFSPQSFDHLLWETMSNIKIPCKE